MGDVPSMEHPVVHRRHLLALVSVALGAGATGCSPDVDFELFNATDAVLSVRDERDHECVLEPGTTCVVETPRFWILDGEKRAEYRPFDGRGSVVFVPFIKERGFFDPMVVRVSVARVDELQLVTPGGEWRDVADPQPDFFPLTPHAIGTVSRDDAGSA